MVELWSMEMSLTKLNGRMVLRYRSSIGYTNGAVFTVIAKLEPRSPFQWLWSENVNWSAQYTQIHKNAYELIICHQYSKIHNNSTLHYIDAEKYKNIF